MSRLEKELARCNLEKRQANYRFSSQSEAIDEVTTERNSLQDQVRILRKAEGDHHTLYVNNATAVANLKMSGRQNIVLDAVRKKLARRTTSALAFALVIARTAQESEQRFCRIKQLEADNDRLLKEASTDCRKLSDQGTQISDYNEKFQQMFREKEQAKEELAWV